MRVAGMSATCDGARAQVSRRLDGEISQLEERMLTAHLERCSDCRTFAADVADFTRDLRAAPLERLEHPIVIRRPRRASLARLQVGVAAAIAIAAIGSVLQIGIRSTGSSSSVATPTKFETTNQVLREVQQIIRDGRAFKRDGGGERAI
jgi:predicted anti-sigma-YlaC factor YlaD